MEADVLVVGAGVVGLAIAATLAESWSVVVAERHRPSALETSSHNSGVIHSGIYYPTGSLKHRLCIEGNRALYAWCADRGVPHHRIGKLVVAVSERETETLDQLEKQAQANEVPDVSRLTAAEARFLEPQVPSLGALFCGTTGIVDQMALARSFEARAKARGAMFAYHHEVTAVTRAGGMFHVKLLDDDGVPSEARCTSLVNAAGHGAPALARNLGYPLDGSAGIPRLRQYPNRGRYYDVVNRAVARGVSHLVYPAPARDAAGLGVHLTLDLDGAMHLGPDAEWMTEDEPLTYQSDDTRRSEFLASARRLLPQLQDDDVVPGQVGYRPKLNGPGETPADFLLWHDHGYIHLGGIESPGLTAAIPLAREVATLLRQS